MTDSGADRITGGEVVRAPIASVSAEITSMSIVDTGGSGSPATPREDRRALKGAVYRIPPDGVWDQLWESRDDSPYDLTFDRDGALIIGTGGKGKIYRLEGDPLRPTLLARAGGAAGHGVLQGPGRPAVLRDGESRQAVPALA